MELHLRTKLGHLYPIYVAKFVLQPLNAKMYLGKEPEWATVSFAAVSCLMEHPEKILAFSAPEYFDN